MPVRRSKRARTNGGLSKPTREETVSIVTNIADVMDDMGICAHCKDYNVDGDDKETIYCEKCKSVFHVVCLERLCGDLNDSLGCPFCD